jgi:protein CpxP
MSAMTRVSAIARPGGSRRMMLAGLAALSIAAAGATALAWSASAQAHGGPAMGRGMHGAEMFGGGMRGPMDPEARGQRIDAMVGRMLAQVDATPEQRSRVAAIFKQTAADLAPVREQRIRMRRETAQLLAAPTIDRAQLEKLRVDQMQLGDTVSRRMLQSMADAAEVLNPEQRAKLAELRQQRMERRGSR